MDGEFYVTVHYNEFLRVDQLMVAAKKGNLVKDDVLTWMNLYTDIKSALYDAQFYKKLQDLAQIAGISTLDLVNLETLSEAKLAQVLAQLTAVFLTILANPPPVIAMNFLWHRENGAQSAQQEIETILQVSAGIAVNG